MSEPVTQTRKKSGRWLRIALLASLAVNLAVVGMVAGAMWRGGEAIRQAGPGRDMALPYARAVDPKDRRTLMRALRGSLDGQRLPRGAREAEYTQALDLLRGDPFDASALRAHMVAQTDRAQARVRAGQDVLVDYLDGLSAAERSEYADRLEEVLHNPRKGQERGKPGGRN